MNHLDIYFYNTFLDVMDLNRLFYKELHEYIKNGTEIFEKFAQSINIEELL